MEPTADLRASLRMKLGEPEEAESVFTDAQIDLMLRGSTSLNRAAVTGWESKVAHFSGLVDVSDGAASRKLGKLYDNALDMLKYYRGQANQGVESTARSRSRVGKIIRHG